MSSLFALYALLLAGAMLLQPMFITCMAPLITGGIHWLRGAILAIQRKRHARWARGEKITGSKSA